jgi:hypothetical protein
LRSIAQKKRVDVLKGSNCEVAVVRNRSVHPETSDTRAQRHKRRDVQMILNVPD